MCCQIFSPAMKARIWKAMFSGDTPLVWQRKDTYRGMRKSNEKSNSLNYFKTFSLESRQHNWDLHLQRSLLD